MNEQPESTIPDTPAATTPVATPQAAPSVEPVAPPPTTDAAQAGAGTPPLVDPPAGDAGAVAPPPIQQEVIESRPRADDAPTSATIDTPAAALAVLGQDSGVAPGTVDIVQPIHPEIPAADHPHDVLQRLRAKLAAYGEECLRAIQHEIEYFTRLHPPKE